MPQQNTRFTERYSRQSSCKSGSFVNAAAIWFENSSPTSVNTSEVPSIRNRPVVAARQASPGFFCPSLRESRAFRPTAVPTPMAIIKNWMAYTREAAVRAVSDSRATKILSTILYSDWMSSDSISGTAIVYSRGRMGISASLFFEFIRPPFSGKQKSAKSLRSSNSSGFHALSVGFLYLVRNVL